MLGRTFQSTKKTLGRLVVAVIVIIVCLLLLVTIAPIGMTLILWRLCCPLFGRDHTPWETSRFTISLFTAWAVDGLLFRIAASSLHTAYRPLVPAIIVLSIAAGYVVWRLLKLDYKEPTEGKARNPFAVFVSLCVSLFLVVSLISPMNEALFSLVLA